MQGRCFDLLHDAAPLLGSAAWDPLAGGPGGLCAPVVTSEEEALELLFEVPINQVTSKRAVHHACHMHSIAPSIHTGETAPLQALG